MSGITITVLTKACHHCKKQCEPVELDDETYQQIDMCGVESLTEVQQAVYEGFHFCYECYCEEGGY